jgi:hypothetical protein
VLEPTTPSVALRNDQPVGTLAENVPLKKPTSSAAEPLATAEIVALGSPLVLVPNAMFAPGAAAPEIRVISRIARVVVSFVTIETVESLPFAIAV